MTRGLRLPAGPLLEEGLDDAVLERMERHDGEPATGLQQRFGRNQRRRELAELVVDVDAERLEHAGRWMTSRLPATADDALDETRELSCARERLRLAIGDDGARNGAGSPLLAQMEEDVGELRLAPAVDDIGGRDPGFRHAHVERAVGLERESALRLVELHGGDADVEDDPVRAREPGFGGVALHVAEAALAKRQSAGMRAEQRKPATDGRGIAVDGDDAAGAGLEQGGRVAARAEGCVNEVLSADRLQCLQHLGEQHGNVTGPLLRRA